MKHPNLENPADIKNGLWICPDCGHHKFLLQLVEEVTEIRCEDCDIETEMPE